MGRFRFPSAQNRFCAPKTRLGASESGGASAAWLGAVPAARAAVSACAARAAARLKTRLPEPQ